MPARAGESGIVARSGDGAGQARILGPAKQRQAEQRRATGGRHLDSFRLDRRDHRLQGRHVRALGPPVDVESVARDALRPRRRLLDPEAGRAGHGRREMSVILGHRVEPAVETAELGARERRGERMDLEIESQAGVVIVD